MQVIILLILRCPPLAAGLEGRTGLDAGKRKSWMASTRPTMTTVRIDRTRPSTLPPVLADGAGGGW
jgi:hypothetical protein